MFLYLYYYNNFHHTWFKESPTDADLATILDLTKLEKSKLQDQESSFSMSKREPTAPVLLMIVVIAEKELMVLLNLDHTLTKNSPRDKKPSQDHTVESSALDVLNQESSEPSYLKKSSQLNKLKKSPKKHDYLNTIISHK